MLVKLVIMLCVMVVLDELELEVLDMKMLVLDVMLQLVVDELEVVEELEDDIQ